jgi:hypothetical protein
VINETTQSELQPETPSAALPVFLAILNAPDSSATPGAMLGLARLAAANPKAADAVDNAFNPDTSPQRKIMAIRAMTGADVNQPRPLEPRLTRHFGDSLSDKDRDVQRAALRAMASVGGDAILLNRDSVVRLAATSTDSELKATARQLLANLPK